MTSFENAVISVGLAWAASSWFRHYCVLEIWNRLNDCYPEVLKALQLSDYLRLQVTFFNPAYRKFLRDKQYLALNDAFLNRWAPRAYLSGRLVVFLSSLLLLFFDADFVQNLRNVRCCE